MSRFEISKMLRSRAVLVLFASLVGSSGVASPENAESTQSVSLFEYTRHMADLAVSRLHYLRIGEADALEQNLIEQVPTDALIINGMIESGNLGQHDVRKLTQYLVLVAVMDEKMEIEAWRQNVEFQAVLDAVRAQNVEEADKLRCMNWSKPMWVDRGDCA